MTQILIAPTASIPVPTMLFDVGTRLAPLAWFCTAFVVFVVVALAVRIAFDPRGSDAVPALRLVPRRAGRQPDREACDQAA
ncbi:MAG: hypothetical protein E6J79_06025 [Deltaproteobacteria bacterium]|nr:MAG: hypothetical protein E6J79_06025 [Deltaproteobacteria bacterium]